MIDASIDLEVLAENILGSYDLCDIEEALSDVDYLTYQDKPVEFCEEILHQQLTDDVKIMLRSIVDNRITIATSANAVGKTHGAACATIWYKKCHPASQVITAAAPPAERNLKAKLWGEIRILIKLNSNVFLGDKINSLYIEDAHNPKSTIQGVTIPASGSEDERESKFSGTHAPYLLFVLDEGDAIPDEVYRAIESCMSDDQARLLVMFNPKRRLGAAYRMIRDGFCNNVHMTAFNHPNVITGKELIIGAVTREQTVRRINKWTKPLHKDEKEDGMCFEVPKFLVGEKCTDGRVEFPPLPAGMRRIEEPQFCYMVLGEYPLLSMYQLINVEWIDDARTRWDAFVAINGRIPPIGVNLVMGLDAAELGQDYNTLCMRYGGFVMDTKRWHGMDIGQTSRKAAIYAHENRASVVNVDATGVGAGIAPAMNLIFRAECPVCRRIVIDPKGKDNPCVCPGNPMMKLIYCNAKRIMVSSKPTEKTEIGEFASLRDQLWWEVREWLRADPGAMLPPSEKLVEELAVPEYKIQNGKIKVMSKDDMRKELGRSPDEADALCLTFSKGEGAPRVRVL